MKICEIDPLYQTIALENSDVQLDALKRQEKDLKVKKAQLKANKALQKLHSARAISP